MPRWDKSELEAKKEKWATDMVKLNGKVVKTNLIFGFDDWGRPSAHFHIGESKYAAEPLSHGWRKVSGKPKDVSVKFMFRDKKMREELQGILEVSE